MTKITKIICMYFDTVDPLSYKFKRTVPDYIHILTWQILVAYFIKYSFILSKTQLPL